MSGSSRRVSRDSPTSRRHGARQLGLVLAAGFALLAAPSVANAQFLYRARPDVVVNLHALDALDGAHKPAKRAAPRPAIKHKPAAAPKRTSSAAPIGGVTRQKVADIVAEPELRSHLLQLPSMPPAGTVYPPAPPGPPQIAAPRATAPRAAVAAEPRPAAPAKPATAARSAPAPRAQTAEASGRPAQTARAPQPEPPPPPPVLTEPPPPPKAAEAPPLAPGRQATPAPAPAPPVAAGLPPAGPARATLPSAQPVAPPAVNPAPEPPPPPPVLAERAPAPAATPARPATPPAAAPPPGPQVATAPAAGAPAAGNRLRLLFDGSSSDLSDSARQELQQLASELAKQSNTRIQLLAYAEGTPTTLSQARRLSLDRALTVRSFLANQGVNTTRIDVRALGNQTGDGAPANRVDLLVLPE